MTKWMLLVASLTLAACNRGQSAAAQTQLGRDASVLNVLPDAGRLMGSLVDAGTLMLQPPRQIPPTQINPPLPPGTNPYAPGQTNPPTVPR